jgi:MBOAT, membrane-bound O-acyltransferase family
MTRTELSLNAYIEQRLGHTPREQLINFLAKPFGAVSFAEFWRYWNPVFSYYLRYAVYLPLRPYLPRPLAVWLTFCACGFVHGLIALILAWLNGQRAQILLAVIFFALLGLVVIVTEAARVRFTRIPLVCRWIIHGATIVLCYRLAEYVVDHFLPRW